MTNPAVGPGPLASEVRAYPYPRVAHREAPRKEPAPGAAIRSFAALLLRHGKR